MKRNDGKYYGKHGRRHKNVGWFAVEMQVHQQTYNTIPYIPITSQNGWMWNICVDIPFMHMSHEKLRHVRPNIQQMVFYINF